MINSPGKDLEPNGMIDNHLDALIKEINQEIDHKKMMSDDKCIETIKAQIDFFLMADSLHESNLLICGVIKHLIHIEQYFLASRIFDDYVLAQTEYILDETKKDTIINILSCALSKNMKMADNLIIKSFSLLQADIEKEKRCSIEEYQKIRKLFLAFEERQLFEDIAIDLVLNPDCAFKKVFNQRINIELYKQFYELCLSNGWIKFEDVFKQICEQFPGITYKHIGALNNDLYLSLKLYTILDNDEHLKKINESKSIQKDLLNQLSSDPLRSTLKEYCTVNISRIEVQRLKRIIEVILYKARSIQFWPVPQETMLSPSVQKEIKDLKDYIRNNISLKNNFTQNMFQKLHDSIKRCPHDRGYLIVPTLRALIKLERDEVVQSLFEIFVIDDPIFRINMAIELINYALDSDKNIAYKMIKSSRNLFLMPLEYVDGVNFTDDQFQKILKIILDNKDREIFVKMFPKGTIRSVVTSKHISLHNFRRFFEVFPMKNVRSANAVWEALCEGFPETEEKFRILLDNDEHLKWFNRSPNIQEGLISQLRNESLYVFLVNYCIQNKMRQQVHTLGEHIKKYYVTPRSFRTVPFFTSVSRSLDKAPLDDLRGHSSPVNLEDDSEDSANYIHLVMPEHNLELSTQWSYQGQPIHALSPSPSPSPSPSTAIQPQPPQALKPSQEIITSIDPKYLGFSKYAPLYRESEQSKQATWHSIQTQSLGALSQISNCGEHQSFEYEIGQSKLEFLSNRGPIEQGEPCIFIMAGRGEGALLLADNDKVRTILVLTQSQYQAQQSKLPNQIDALVIHALNSPSHGSFDPNSFGLLIPRRIATFLFAHVMQIEHFMMADDNVKEFLVSENHEIYSSQADYIYQTHLEGLEQSQALSVGLHTIRPDRSFRAINHRFGAKVIMFDMKIIRGLFPEAEHMFYLLPPAKCADWCNEDYFYLSVLHEAAKVVDLTANKVLDPNVYVGIKRSIQQVNLCAKTTRKAQLYVEEDFTQDINFNAISQPYVDFILKTKAFLAQSVIEHDKRFTQRNKTMNLVKLHADANQIQYDRAAQTAPAILDPTKSAQESLVQSIKTGLSSMTNILFYHQIMALQAITENPKSRGYLKMCMGSGKTYCQIALAHLASRQQPIHIVTSSRSLVKQTFQSLIESFDIFNDAYPESGLLKQNILKISSNQADLKVSHLKDFSHQIKDRKMVMIFCKESYDIYVKTEHFVPPQCLLFDEFHLASNAQLETILTHSGLEAVPIYGLSATPPENSLFQEKLYTYSRQQALKDKRVSPIITGTMNFNSDILPQQMVDLLQNQLHPEGECLMQHKGIVYVKNTKIARQIAQHLREKLSIEIYEIHSKYKYHKSDLKKFRDDRIPGVAIAVQMMREGVDVFDVDYVIIAKQQVNSDLVAQICGRAMRLNPENIDKICYLIGPHSMDLSYFDETIDDRALEMSSFDFLKQHLRQMTSQLDWLHHLLKGEQAGQSFLLNATLKAEELIQYEKTIQQILFNSQRVMAAIHEYMKLDEFYLKDDLASTMELHDWLSSRFFKCRADIFHGFMASYPLRLVEVFNIFLDKIKQFEQRHFELQPLVIFTVQESDKEIMERLDRKRTRAVQSSIDDNEGASPPKCQRLK